MDRRTYNREWNRRNKDHVRAYRDARKAERNRRRRERYHVDTAYREKIKSKVRAFAKANPIAKAASAYKVDRDRLELLLERGCAICGAGWAPGIKVRLHCDHDHKSKEFRGVLCENCNHGIGKFYDDPYLLMAAADYLLRDLSERVACRVNCGP